MRNLTNCIVAGLFAAVPLVQILFLVNPRLPADGRTVALAYLVLAASYGIAVALGLWLLLVFVEELRGDRLRPAWLSVRLLTWLGALTLGVAAALAWHNLFYYRLYLTPPAIRALAVAATALSGAAALLLVLALFHYSFGRRAAWVRYTLAAGAVAVATLVPFAARPDPPVAGVPVPRLPLVDTPSPRPVTIVGIEGASMSYVLPAVAEGRLPNFGRLLEGGASGALRTLHPTESLAVWTSIASGKLPRRHGLSGFYRYRLPGVDASLERLPRGPYLAGLERLGLLRRTAATSRQRQTQPFWSILSGFGVSVGLVRWWGTYPAEPVDGFVVSEFFPRQVRERIDPPLPELTYPAHLAEELAPLVLRPEQIGDDELAHFVDETVPVDDEGLDWRGELRRALAEDETVRRIGHRLRADERPQVLGVYFFGLDIVGHTFLRYELPDRFGDVSDDELRKYGRVLDTYYARLDAVLGEYLDARRPEEILIVLSGHGMEPLPLFRRVLETFKGHPYLSGYHEAAPDGLIILYGPGIARGAKLTGASVLDVTPTLLYLMGLPLGRDMDGRLLSGALEETLVRSRPVTFISSYHNFLIEPRRADEPPDGPSPLDALPALLDGRE